VISLSKQEAMGFLLEKQGLGENHRFSGKQGVFDFVRQCSCIQFDPLSICCRNDTLVLHSRVEGYQVPMLETLLYEDRVLFDYWDKNLSILPTSDWPCFASVRQHFRSHGVRSLDSVEQVAQKVLDSIAVRGPLCSQDLGMDQQVDWWWSPTSLGRAVLETLYFQGALVIHHKEKSRKYYDLASHLLPRGLLEQSAPFADDGERLAWHLKRRIGAVGLLWNRSSAAYLGIREFDKAKRDKTFKVLLEKGEILEVAVEGIPNTLYMLAQDRPMLSRKAQDGGSCRTEFLGPLDSLLWDRDLVRAIFGFDYFWEVYTPQVKRKFGYYVLPVLYGDAFIARIEPVRDTHNETLEIRSCWFENPTFQGTAQKQAIMLAAQRLASCVGCSKVTFPPDFPQKSLEL